MKTNLNQIISSTFSDKKQFEKYLKSKENCFVGWVDSYNAEMGYVNVLPAIQDEIVTQENVTIYKNKPFLINCWVIANTLNRNPQRGDKALLLVLDEKSNNFFKAQYSSTLPLEKQTSVNTSKAIKSKSNCVAIIVNPNYVSGSGQVSWGDIIGDLENQTDLINYLNQTYQTQIDNLQENLSTETTNRENADDNLQTQISNINTNLSDYASKDYVQTETSLLLTNASVDNETGIFTFQRKNGTTFTIDTLLEKVVTNFTYNETTQSLELTLEDGTIKSIPMTAFIDDYTGSNGTYINVTVSNDNKISATIKNGSITEDLLSIQLQDKIDSIVDYSGDINKILNNTSIIANSNGGFKGGVAHSGSVVDVTSGGAVGNLAKTTSGGSIGNNAETTSGGAVGNEANSGLGGAIGDNAVTTSGGSVGNGAISGLGFSGGRNAKVRLTDANDNTTGIDAIQLGDGTNQTAKTLQVYDDNIYNANTHTMSVQNLEVNGQNIDDKIDGFVSYGQTQNLADAEKQRARNNIGAGTSNFSGSYNDLTDKPASSNVQDIIDNVTVISQPKPDNTTSGSEVTQYSGYGGFVAGSGAELNEVENSISFGGQTITTVTRGSGGAVGQNAKANDGGAIGNGAEATNGFSGGENAKSATDAIQLGSGTNNTYHSLQVYGDNIYNASTHTMSVQNLEVENNNFVTTNTTQDITGQKTFIGKEIILEQTSGYRGFRVNNTDITRGQVTESATGAGRLIFYDNQNNILGYLQVIAQPDGTTQLQLFAGGDTNNANIFLNAKPDGTTEIYTDDTIRVTRGSTRYLDANNGAVPINLDRSGGVYNMLARMKSTNGVFLIGTYQNRFMITYTSNETIEAGTNAVDKQWWFNEDGSLMITNSADASGSSYNGPALVIGGTQNQAHIEIDSNEIMAKSNATTPTSLFLNSDGGEVWIGSNANGFHFVTNLDSNNFFGPVVNKGASLGNVEYRWLNAYLTNLNVSGSTSVPTPPTNDNSTKIATTEWVNNKINILGGIPTGTIVAFAGSNIPDGWLLCDGGAISRTTYSNLFTAIETTYGSGNGSTTFNLPNLIDKFIEGSSTVGTEISAGLPNITGELVDNLFGNNVTNPDYDSGAFVKPTSTSNDRYVNWTDTNREAGFTSITFNASNSNSIYGNSTTVQPPALTMQYIIKY